MNREVHVRICGRLGVKFPGPTRQSQRSARPSSQGESERSVEQKREPMNKNRIGGLRCRASWPMTAKQISTASTGGKFGCCDTPSVLRGLDQWIPRLRAMIWKQRKRGKVRFRNLRQRNIGTALRPQTAGSSHGPCAAGQEPGFAVRISYCLLRLARDPRLFDVLWLNRTEPGCGPACPVGGRRASGRPLPLCRSSKTHAGELPRCYSDCVS
jgi:hypothetical protein